MKFRKTIVLCLLGYTICTPYVKLGYAKNLDVYQNSGITLDKDATSYNALDAIGRIDSDTIVFTDSDGLIPKADLQAIQRTQNLSDAEATSIPATNNVVRVSSVSNIPKYSNEQKEFMYYDENDDLLLSKGEFLMVTLSIDSNKMFNYYDVNNDNYLNISEFTNYYTD